MIRIGQGFDVHRLAAGRPLKIGGVEIPFEKGLLGHSDADALYHAVTDAVLGALGEGDIGRHFPDADPRYRGMDSAWFLETVWQMAREKRWLLGNLDATLIAQRPKLAPYLPQMRENIARILQAGTYGQVNVKATTTERLGFPGREEGIVAQAVILLVREEHDQQEPSGRSLLEGKHTCMPKRPTGE